MFVYRSPGKEFTGKVIAIIHRLNDVEDKWVAVPEDMDYDSTGDHGTGSVSGAVFETEIEMLE